MTPGGNGEMSHFVGEFNDLLAGRVVSPRASRAGSHKGRGALHWHTNIAQGQQLAFLAPVDSPATLTAEEQLKTAVGNQADRLLYADSSSRRFLRRIKAKVGWTVSNRLFGVWESLSIVRVCPSRERKDNVFYFENKKFKQTCTKFLLEIVHFLYIYMLPLKI